MTATYDDPNREAIGLAPIWTGAGDEPDPPPEGDDDDDGETKSTTRKAKSSK